MDEFLKQQSKDDEVGLVLLQGLSSTDWAASLSVNTLSAGIIAEALSKTAVAQDRQLSVSLIGSLASYCGRKMPYATAKSALVGLMHSLNNAFSPNVRANLIVPGAFPSAMTADWSDEKAREIGRGTFRRRLSQPGEVVAAIEFATKNNYIVDSVINMSGQRIF